MSTGFDELLWAVTNYDPEHPDYEELSDIGDGQYLASAAADLIQELRRGLAAAQAELAREKSPESSFTETGTARLLPNGRLGCLDCGAEYGGPRFPDLVLPHDVWAKISPNGDGGGLLCPCCINARLAAAGISNVFGRFVSGPLAIDPEPSAVVDLIKDAIHLAAEAGKSPIHAKLCEALDLLAIRDAEARELRERAEKAERNYQWMVERAADQHLSGYRELARRAADADNVADGLRTELARLREALENSNRIILHRSNSHE